MIDNPYRLDYYIDMIKNKNQGGNKMQTINGREIEIRKTANTDMTPVAYTVYVGGIRVSPEMALKDARELAESLTQPISKHMTAMMEECY
jgi:hypothetical protein